MNWLYIEEILNKFWDGQSSLAEEKQLKEAFLSDDVPVHLKPFAVYFKGTDELTKQAPGNADFEQRFEEQTAKPIRRRLMNTLAYAAGFAILIAGSYLFFKPAKAEFIPLTPDEARIAQKYLSLMSSSFEKSTRQSTIELDKLVWVSRSTNSLAQIQKKQKNNTGSLKHLESFDQSFIKLKYLNNIENNKIKL